MSDTFTLTLAGREYEITPLCSEADAAWRALVYLTVNEPLRARTLSYLKYLLLAMDKHCLMLLCAYAPSLSDDWEWIEQHATTADVVATLMQLLKIVAPSMRLTPVA